MSPIITVSGRDTAECLGVNQARGQLGNQFLRISNLLDVSVIISNKPTNHVLLQIFPDSVIANKLRLMPIVKQRGWNFCY